ncbi:MAG: bifunctional oligoribonuclease/PAP phosphatase NrnA [Oscillospiraceae bacterium]|nr:bifunctional oligoribonuclease/PAP phosphatase NrnA [Oscillospiraceae bacterium]
MNTREAGELLFSRDDILILCHQNPDGDTLGSGFALLYALLGAGKRARLECSDPIPKNFAYLQREEEGLSFEPAFVVAVDIADLQLLGKGLEAYRERVDLCLDHHPSNTYYARETCLDAGAGATAEVALQLIREVGRPVTPLIANCIYTGLATDTGCFRYSNVSPRTLRMAADMLEAGADAAQINRVMFETKSQSRIAIEKDVLNTVEYYFEGRCALIYITREMLETTGADEGELDGVSALPRQIEGVEVGVTLREKDGGYKVSLRTTEYIDASLLCKKLGGGGHARAAGCFLQGSLRECIEEITRAVGEALTAHDRAAAC